MTLIVYTLDSKNKNLFGINEIIKNLKKKLIKDKISLEIINEFDFIKLKKKIKVSKIVHIQGCWSIIHILAFIFAKIYRKKLFFSPHGMLMPQALKISFIKKKIALFCYQKIILNNSDHIIVNSFKEKIEIKKISYNNNITIIPHGIKVNNINFFKKKNKKIKFVFYSRIHPIKGLYELVKNWSQSNKLKNIKLDIYGQIENKEYFAKVQKYFGKNINYLGSIKSKDKYKILKNYDVLVFPSLSENFGMVILECLNCGLFIIIRRGLPWNFLSPRFAKFIEFNQHSLEKNVLLISKSKKLSSHKNQLRLYLQKNFNIDNLNLKYLKTYNI